MIKRIDFSNHRVRLTLLLSLMMCVLGVMVVVFIKSGSDPEILHTEQPTTTTEQIPVEPQLQTEVLLGNLQNVWELAFLPDNRVLFTERKGQLSIIENNQKRLLMQVPGILVQGEGGLMGMTLDSEFTQNRLLYLCFNTRSDIRVVRWQLTTELSLINQKELITNMPTIGGGRHSGCRLKVGADGVLWVGTGDAAAAANPQDPKSLGGKILRVDREGNAVAGNMSEPFDPRIFSYGHRNTQGLILSDTPVGEVFGYSVEHGPTRDDELNLLKKGNFGWAPQPSYVETVPMTDLARFPEAISAVWSSGSPTIAPSGGTQLRGRQWGTWDGALALATLKGKHVRIMSFNGDQQLQFEKSVLSEFGRIRSALLAPDGNLYLSTDNGFDDKIVKVTPTGN